MSVSFPPCPYCERTEDDIETVLVADWNYGKYVHHIVDAAVGEGEQ